LSSSEREKGHDLGRGDEKKSLKRVLSETFFKKIVFLQINCLENIGGSCKIECRFLKMRGNSILAGQIIGFF
jgi:hypothetical protein